MEQDQILLTVDQLAERLQISSYKVRVLYREGKIPRLKLGYRNVRFLWSDVIQAIKASNDAQVKKVREQQPDLPLG